MSEKIGGLTLATPGETDGWQVVTVAGELDVYTAPQLRQLLIHKLAENPRVVLDLSGLAYMDSTGFGVMVGALKRARHIDGDLRLAGPSENIRKVFDTTGLSAVFTIADTVEEAIVGRPGNSS